MSQLPPEALTIRERHELAIQGFPQLQEYVDRCRAKRLTLELIALADDQLEQFRLITEAFRERGLKEWASPRQATSPLIITTSDVGLLAIPPLLPTDTAFMAVLLTDEFEAWRQTLGRDSFCDPWWYEHWWCTVVSIDDHRLRESYNIEDTAALRRAGDVWELSCGSASGGLAGAWSERLYLWNGTSAVPTEFEAFCVA